MFMLSQNTKTDNSNTKKKVQLDPFLYLATILGSFAPKQKKETLMSKCKSQIIKLIILKKSILSSFAK